MPAYVIVCLCVHACAFVCVCACVQAYIYLSSTTTRRCILRLNDARQTTACVASRHAVTDARRLTDDGEDDDDEVEDVPRLLEVVPPQADQLHHALDREDGDEDGVDVSEHVLHLLRLAVVLEPHRHHVHHDDRHDGDVKLLVGRQFEEEQLALQLLADRALICGVYCLAIVAYNNNNRRNDSFLTWLATSKRKGAYGL